MHLSRSRFVSRISLFLLLLIVAAITHATEAATPYAEVQRPTLTAVTPQLDNPFDFLSTAPATRDDLIDKTVPEDLSLFRLPLVGYVEDFGFRVASADGGKFDGLTQQALFIDFRLPWQWSPWPDVSASPKLVLEAGRFNQGSENRLFASLGPTLRLASDRWRVPVFVDLGLSPTIIDGSSFGDQDFGTSFNFTSHIALGLRFGRTKNHVVKLRLQHISNSGIDDVNPGVNMIGVDVVLWAR